MFLRKLNVCLRRAVTWLMRAVDVPRQSKMVILRLILDSDCYRIPTNVKYRKLQYHQSHFHRRQEFYHEYRSFSYTHSIEL